MGFLELEDFVFSWPRHNLVACLAEEPPGRDGAKGLQQKRDKHG